MKCTSVYGISLHPVSRITVGERAGFLRAGARGGTCTIYQHTTGSLIKRAPQNLSLDNTEEK